MCIRDRSEAAVTLTIEGVNDAPIPVDPSQPAGPSDPTDPSDPQDPRDPPVDPLNFIPAQSVEDGSPVTPLDLTPFFGDPDSSDALTLFVDPADLPDGLVFDPVTGILSGTPSSDASQGGTDGLHSSSHRDGPKRRCLLYTSPSPRDLSTSRMPSFA